VAGSCEQGNETSGPIKGEEFLGQLSAYNFLQKISDLRSYLFIYLLNVLHIHVFSILYQAAAPCGLDIIK